MILKRKNWQKELLNRIQKVKQTTNEKEIKAKRKREIKKELESEKIDTPDFSYCEKKYNKTKKNIVNWFHVQRWFIENIRKNNPDWLVIDSEKTEKWTERKQTWWTWKEKNCAQRLLDHYGEDVVRETIEWFCKNWQGIVDESNGRLSGSPSVNLLWASRDRFFVDAKLGYVPGKKKKIKKHMVGEYDPKLDGSTKVGW